MKTLFILFLCLLSSKSIAEDSKQAKSLESRIQFEVQSFVTNSDGSKLLEIGGARATAEAQTSSKTINMHFKDYFKNLPDVNLEYEIKETGPQIYSVSIIQYDKMDYDFKTGKESKGSILKKDSFQIKDFGSINWVWKASENKNIVVRLVPSIIAEPAAEKMRYTPISLVDSIVTDNQNNVWDEGGGGSGEVVMFRGKHGTIFFSLTEFKGSKEFGSAYKNQIELKLTNNLTVRVRSSEAIIGAAYRSKVFGVYLPNRKSRSYFGMMEAEQAVKEIESKD